MGVRLGAPRGGEWRVNYGQNREFAGTQWAAKKDFPTAPKVSGECLGGVVPRGNVGSNPGANRKPFWPTRPDHK